MSESFNPKLAWSFVVVVVALVSVLLWQATRKPQPTGTYVDAPFVNLPYIPKKTTLFLAGDIMLSRNVAAAMYKVNDFKLPFVNVTTESIKADIAFANLESPFNSTGDHSVEGSLVFNADPLAIEGLKYAGFDVLSTANNHSWDQGAIGLNHTLGLLIDNGIFPSGTGTGVIAPGSTISDCHNGVYITKNDIKFGFLSYSYAGYNDGGRVANPQVCDWNDQVQVAEDVAKAKLESDFLIVSAHMGTEYKRNPDQDNVELSRAAIDAGADMIVGHHPHWIQTIEEYKGRYIFYSLGNFVFDQMWSIDTREGLTMNVEFADKQLSKITFNPVIIESYCCPRWANEEESLAILKKINLTNRIISVKN